MERIFHLKENGTSVKTEILAGLTTFMTMAYIIALNPNLLTGFQTGTPLWNGVFLATCIASAIGTVVMAFLANKPFVMAPGMGLNSFFAVIAGNVAAMLNTDYTSAFQAVLCIILVEGIVFLLLSVFNIRDKIVHAIPLGVRLGIGPAIGLMLMNIGLGSNVGIYAEGNGYTSPFYVMRDFFGAMTPSVIKDHMGAEYSQMVLTVITMFIGLFVIILLAKNIDGVYDSDPAKNADAVKFDSITYDEVLKRHLAVMDSTATSLSMDNHIPVLVFALKDPENIIRALRGEKIGTIVKED